MIIEKCYVSNFGTLSDKTFNFDKNLTCILEENGQGKTTLAYFIAAMFYGLESTRKTKLDENIRKKYLPWNNGNYGGNIDFRTEKGHFRIERFFGDEDEFSLIDLNSEKESNVYSAAAGEEIFGIGFDSFLRSVFMPQTNISAGITADIGAKLTNLIDDTDDINNFDTVIEKLENKRKTYALQRGRGGLIADTEDKIAIIQNKIASAQISSKRLVEYTENLRVLKEKHDDLSTQKSVVHKKLQQSAFAEADSLKKKSFLETENNLNEIKSQIESLNVFFKNGIPEIEEIEKIKEEIKTQTEIVASVKELQKTTANDERFTELQKFFANRIPSDSEITEIVNTAENYKTGIAKLETLTASTPQISEDLTKHFENGIPSDNEIDKIKFKIHTLTELEANINVTEVVPQKTKKTPTALFLILAIVFAAIGVICVLKPITALAIVSFVLMFLSLCFAGFSYFKNYLSAKLDNKQGGVIAPEISAKKIQLNEEISTFLLKYNFDNTDIRLSFSSLVLAEQEFLRATKQLEFYKKQLAEQQEENNRNLKALKQTLSEYFDDEFEFSQVATLQNNFSEFCTLNIHYGDKEKSIEKYKTDYKKSDEVVNAWLEKYGFIKPQNLGEFLQTVLNCKEKLANLENELKITEEKYNALKSELSESSEPQNDIIESVEELKAKDNSLENAIKSVESSIIEVNKQINTVADDADLLADLMYEKDELNLKIEDYKHKFEILGKTIDFLKKAKNKLSDSYLKDVKGGFEHYFTALLGNNNTEFLLDNNLNLKIVENGKGKDAAYYSQGYKDIFDICLRLSLIDAVFENERPIMILDDPFVNLDDAKTKEALQLLKKLSENLQIIYLTCNTSRKI